MPPASLAATSVERRASSSEVLPWSTWPMTVTIGGRGLQVLLDVGDAFEALLDVGLADALHLVPELGHHELGRIRVQALVDRGQDAVLHQHLDHLGAADRHAGGEVLDGDGLGQDDLADDELGRTRGLAALALALAAQGREAGTAALDQLRVAAQHQAVEPLGHGRRIAIGPAGCRPLLHLAATRLAAIVRILLGCCRAAGRRTLSGSATSATPGRARRSSVVAAGAAPPRVSRSFCRRSSSASSLEASSSALRRASSSCRRRASSSALRLAAASSSARRRAASSVARREFSTARERASSSALRAEPRARRRTAFSSSVSGLSTTARRPERLASARASGRAGPGRTGAAAGDPGRDCTVERSGGGRSCSGPAAGGGAGHVGAWSWRGRRGHVGPGRGGAAVRRPQARWQPLAKPARSAPRPPGRPQPARVRVPARAPVPGSARSWPRSAVPGRVRAPGPVPRGHRMQHGRPRRRSRGAGIAGRCRRGVGRRRREVRVGATGARVFFTSTATALLRPWLKLCRTMPVSTGFFSSRRPPPDGRDRPIRAARSWPFSSLMDGLCLHLLRC